MTTLPIVLIPALKPQHGLVALLRELRAQPEIGGLIVVDDGSGAAYCEVFEEAAECAQVLRHAVNLGKGAALKMGMNFAACEFPQSAGVVTADADGQHSATDIVRVARALSASRQELILGARAFDGSVPARSRFGNSLTRMIMRGVTGQKLADTQTGLRGVPMDFIPDLLRLRSTGYDFELDMLVKSRETGRTIREVPIETIYVDGNRSSHFNPLRDSMRIYFVFVRFTAVSLLTALIDNGVFVAGFALWPHVAAVQTVSRLVAGCFQFFAGRRGVFHSQVRVASAMPKFWALTIFSGVLSYLLIESIVRYTSLGVVPAKIAAESILFAISFVVQRDFVFRPGQGTKT